jgi:hypothetical protein
MHAFAIAREQYHDTAFFVGCRNIRIDFFFLLLHLTLVAIIFSFDVFFIITHYSCPSKKGALK